MDAFRRSSSAPRSSASLCPGCGKAVDPLRAGHVAILEGGFRYFCGADCKTSFVEVSSKRGVLEAATAEPPVVAKSTARPKLSASEREEEARSIASGVRTQGAGSEGGAVGDETNAPAYFPAPRTEAHEIVAEDAPSTLRSSVVVDGEEREEGRERAEEREEGREREEEREDEREDEREERREREGEGEREDERASEGQREDAGELAADDPHDADPDSDADSAPAPAPSFVARAKKEARRVVLVLAGIAPHFGIALGVLAFVISLAGEGGTALRLPFALVSAAILVASSLLRPREPSAPAPWFVIGPVVLAAFGAVLSLALRDPHADSHAAYVGLAAAGALLVDLLVVRSRRDIGEARARIASALATRVRVVNGEATSDVDAAQVKPGEQVVAEGGEVVGVDGIVAAGEAEVGPWIDSPVLLTKREGDAIVAGATIVSGRLRITATFAGADRAWLKLGQSPAARVDVAAPLVALARRTVERGSPIAALLVGGATYANNGGWPEVVIAASAGAYALAGVAAVAAAAIAHARGHIAAQRRGIVYKDADAFDAAARADVAVVCSRGTILLGEPEIVVVEAVPARSAEAGGSAPRVGSDKEQETARVLSLAAGAEMASSDAFAAAILRASRARGVRPENVRSALVHSGLGVTALAPNGDKVIVGSRAFLLKEKVSVAIADSRATELEAQGRSVLLVALGGRLVGLLALQDGLRPGARASVQRMHDARIEPVLLSGEARDTCETIARALDIEHVRPEILPADRGAEVRALADGGRVVAAVGHPSSDDGALGAADVSVAMTAAGAAPGEWSVSLASDDVRDAALALTVPRACRERAKTATLVGAAAQGVSILGIAFGAAPPALAPIVAALAAAFVLALVREPTTLTPMR
jgi:P-type Cu+ transporter